MAPNHALIIGGGVGGLSAALSLASAGLRVSVFEAQADIGGKMRALNVGGSLIDAGPTVFTMKWVFDGLFDGAGLNFDSTVRMTKANLLARHAWDTNGYFDLFANTDQSTASVASFFGAKEAANFQAFAREAAKIYQLLEEPFLKSTKPSQLALSAQLGTAGFAVRPFTQLWKALDKRFDDPRLTQLFGRYATYTGASPFLAPATLMLIAHVEMDGVWLIEGGMKALAQALRDACLAKGVAIQTDAPVAEIEIGQKGVEAIHLNNGERHTGDIVVANADASALADGYFGTRARRAVRSVKPSDRSLSAIAWTLKAKTAGFPLAHHTVFFGQHYRAEFDAIFAKDGYPEDPTVYICAQDRSAEANEARQLGPERMLMVINAPPNGDRAKRSTEMDQCMERALTRLDRCGLTVDVDAEASIATGPRDFNQLLPATGGALYGRANHSPLASFRRPANKTKIPGLYLAGGSVHPGPGVPMAALSGRLAAAQILADLVSTGRSPTMATVGGTLMA